MKFGTLQFEPVGEHSDWVAKSVAQALAAQHIPDVLVAQNDAEVADTAAYCAAYGIPMEQSANCVIVEAKRADRTWYAACIILATDRADINNVVRKHLEARKISFAPKDHAVSATGMEFGGIAPIGLPADWPILVDEAVTRTDWVIIGSGIRGSKLLVRGSALAALPNATVLHLAKPQSA